MSDLLPDDMMAALVNLDPETSIVRLGQNKWAIHSPNRDDEHPVADTSLAAIQREWAAVSDGRTIVRYPGKRNERWMRWIGTMWEDVARPVKPRKPAPDAPAPEAAGKADLLPMDVAEAPPKRKGVSG